MKAKKSILETTLILSLIMVNPFEYKRPTIEYYPSLNKSEVTQNIEKESPNHYNPFIVPKGKFQLDKIDSTKIKINEKAQKFLEKTLNEAEKIYEREKEVRKNNEKLISLIQEYNSEKLNPEKMYERMRLNKMRGISINNSKWVEGSQVYSLDNETSQKQMLNYLDSLEYFGAAFFSRDNLFYNPKKAREFMQRGLKPVDCTSFILESMSRGQKRNFNLESLSQGSQISNFLKKIGFESIYIAENTLDDSKEYLYGNKKQFCTKDFMKKIKNETYEFQVDYIVTDKNFKNPLFKKFLEESSGFAFFQEGTHIGFLDKGNFLDAHTGSDLINSSVFSLRNFYELMDNDRPERDYQSAVICLPKGSVNKFIYDNSKKD